MASISRQANGRRTIQFIGPDGKRRSIRLGKCTQRVAEALKLRIEQLNSALIAGHTVDADTARWIANLDVNMAARLASAGLIPERETATLAAFIDDYIESRSDVGEGTQTTYRNARRNLVVFFGETKPLSAITRGDADQWRVFMEADQGLADNTIRRRTGCVKQFFRHAIRKGLISFDPFDDLPSSVRAVPERFYFITRDEIRKVIDACPDDQWRLIFALTRFGGLRNPSETLALRWGDVNWELGRITVHSRKTERHPGGSERVIPLFAELRPYLEESFELAEPGDEFLITRYRDTEANLRTQAHKIIRRAGLSPWPKVFQNLRSTRQTELTDEGYPLQTVCAWLGNSQPVAMKHYLQVHDEHFARAIRGGVETGAESGAPVVHFPVQQAAASHCTESHEEKEPVESNGVMHDHATECKSVQIDPMGDTGLEPVTSAV